MGGLPSDDPRTKHVKELLHEFAAWAETELHASGQAGFRTEFSKGAGAFPRYTWVYFWVRCFIVTFLPVPPYARI